MDRRVLVIRVVGALFILGGVVHWLIIFGVLEETAPLLITAYFHSLAVFSPLAGLGLIRLQEWGRKLGLVIALTQLPAHGYMLYLDAFQGWESGLSSPERLLDMGFAAFFLAFFTRPETMRRFLPTTR